MRSEILELCHKNQESTLTELDPLQCPAKWPSVRIAYQVFQPELTCHQYTEKLAGPGPPFIHIRPRESETKVRTVEVAAQSILY